MLLCSITNMIFHSRRPSFHISIIPKSLVINKISVFRISTCKRSAHKLRLASYFTSINHFSIMKCWKMFLKITYRPEEMFWLRWQDVLRRAPIKTTPGKLSIWCSTIADWLNFEVGWFTFTCCIYSLRLESKH